MEAWLGFAVMPTKTTFFAIRICFMCPDAPQARLEAKKFGFGERRSLCEGHYNSITTKRLGQNETQSTRPEAPS